MAEPAHNWYLDAWFEALNVRFPHPWLMKELGYSSGKASNILTGKREYDRQILNEVARAMHRKPYELLMHPEEANAIVRMRSAAETIAATPAPMQAEETLPDMLRRLKRQQR